ncbi:MAG: alpha/beta hydrolase [Hyphomicrobiales bacterium]|nr:alpha/beta hydrolase [Hyphomicrobiales bacterium]
MTSVLSEAPEWMAVASTPPRRIAVRRRAGKGTPILWVGGFRSDMMSTKALTLDALAARLGHPMIRFDYAAHGESPGRFEEMTLSDWLFDTLTVIDTLGDTPPVIVGSSMGGWITLLAMRERHRSGKAPPKALVLIAPAVDFTEELMWKAFPDSVKQKILEEGVYHQPSAYGEPYSITKKFIEDGRNHLMFGAPITPHAPVHILQGMKDPDVPVAHMQRLLDHMPEADVGVSYVKEGDHRLSRPEDLEFLERVVERML